MNTRSRTHRIRRASGLAAGVAAASILAAPAADAQSESSAEPEAVGAVAVCAVCHGPEGGGRNRLAAPRIGGLADWYVERQLMNFRRGIRGGKPEDIYGTQMHAIALTLEGPAVIADVADHISSLTPEWPEQTVSGDAERGEQLYSVCTACHGEQGRGDEQLNTPSLVGMSDWYLLRQLQYFSNGTRGTHPQDKFGAQMVPIMAMFEGRQDLVDLVAYINTFSDAPASRSSASAGSGSGADSGSEDGSSSEDGAGSDDGSRSRADSGDESSD